MTYAPLRLFLHENGISITDLVRDLGFSSATVSKIRKNEYLSLSTIIAISKFYNLPIEKILFIGTDKEYINKFYLSTDSSITDIMESVT